MIRLQLILLVFTVFSFSFGQKFSFDTYSTNSGLSQSQVYDIEQDNQGYLWIATEGGVNQFDGETFKIYTTVDGLVKDAVRCMYFADSGEKYFGSIGGVSCLKGEKVEGFIFADSSSYRINCISKYRDTIFVGTNGNGLYYLSKGLLYPYPFLNTEGLKIRSLFVNDSQLMIGTNKGLHIKYESQGSKVYRKGSNSDISISIGEIKESEDRIFVGSYNDGIYEYKNKKLIKVDFIQDKEVIRNFEVLGSSIYCIERSALVKYDLKTKKRDFIIYNDNGLPKADLLTTFVDRENNVWIGTSGKGVSRFIGETFVSYTSKEGLSSSQIMSIKKLGNTYFFGSYNNGVTIWENNQPTQIINEENGLLNNTVWDLHVISKEKLLIGTESGLELYENGRFVNLTESLFEDQFRVTTICEFDKDQYLIGGNNGLLFLNNGVLETSFHSAEISVYVRDIAISPDGVVWVATINGLYYIKGTKLTKIKASEDVMEVNSIDFFKSGVGVIGTENGVYFIKDFNLKKAEIELGKSSHQVNMIVASEKDNLFFGTNNGIYISKVDLNTIDILEFKHFSAKDGLPGSEININSAHFSENNLWFGTEEALVKFNLNKVSELEDHVPPKIVISNLEIFMEGKELSDFSSGIDANGFPVDLELPYRFNYFSIEFNGLSFKNNKDILYQYKLEGLNDQWTPLLENNFATFTSLSPGTYTFKVRAINKSGMKSEITEFTFVVLPPIYLTWWFITLAILALIGIVVLIIQVRTKAIKQRKDNENLVYKSKLLQLEQQSLNASMNRHFIFNSLNSIQYFINVSDKISANKYLTNFAKLIRKNLDSTTNENNMVLLSDEIARLELYLSLENMRFSGKFDYSIDVEPDVDVEMVQVPSMMLQPFVENSIIHGILPKKEKGIISINVFNKDDFTVFEIVDNGIGINNSRKLKEQQNYSSEHDSKGMEITANRVDILKRILRKDLNIKGPNETYDENGSITGTRVEIYLKTH